MSASNSPLSEPVMAELAPIQPPDDSRPVEALLVGEPAAPDAESRKAVTAELVDKRTWPTRCLVWIGSAFEWLFGLASLLAGLATLASLPVLQWISLGYLMESSGRIARSGKLGDGFIGVRKAGRLGSLVLGTWLMLLPLRALSGMWHAAYLIDPGGQGQRWGQIGLAIATTMMTLHILCAWYCGGRLRHFFWPFLAPFSLAIWLLRRVFGVVAAALQTQPIQRSFLQRLLADITRAQPLDQWFLPAMIWSGIRRRRGYQACCDAVWETVVSLRLPYYFSLGLRGFLGALVWLAIPVGFYIGATTLPPGPAVLSGLLGALLLSITMTYLPFLEVRFAMENRLRAMFEPGRVHGDFRHAPWAFWLALTITLAFALPLYLLEIEATPEEAAFLCCLVFVAFVFPARLLTGWAVGCSIRRAAQGKPAHFVFRWTARLGFVPVTGFYVLLLFFTRYTSWNGVWSLFGQPAVLTPTPFWGWN